MFLSIVVIAPRQSWATAPANDNFAAAQLLSGASGSVSGTTVGSTVETGEPNASCGSSVWYRFVTGPSGGTLVVSPMAANWPSTPNVTVYTGTAVSALTAKPSNPANTNNQTGTFSSVATAPNTTYEIQVWGYSAAAFTLSWACSPPPANDNFSNLTGLTGVSGSIAGTTMGSTLQVHEPSPNSIGFFPTPQGGSVWYRTTLPRGKTVLTATGNVAVTAYTGTSFAGLQVSGYNLNSANSWVFSTTYGTTTYIQVTGESAFGDSFTLSYNFVPAPSNDTVAKAIVLAPAGGQVNGTTLGALYDPLGPIGSYPNYGSVWYQLTPGPSTVDLTTNAGLRITVFAGSNVLPQQDYGASVRFSAAPGTVYQIELTNQYTTAPLGTNFQFSWRVDPVPLNDNFSNAAVLTGTAGAQHGTTTGATIENFYSSAGETNDVWYRYTPPSASGGVVQFRLAGPSINAMGAYTGSTLANLVPLQGGSWSNGFSLPTVPGTSIYIEVATVSVSGAPFTVSWQWNPNPPNDLFANAQPVSGTAGSVAGTTVGATIEPLEPSIGSQSVWYRYTAPTTGAGRVQFTLSNFANSAGIITACSGATLYQLTPEDSGNTAVSITTTPGAPIYIEVCIVYGSSASTASPFTLSWNWIGAPANDNFASAQLLSGASGTVAGTTVGSSIEDDEPSSFYNLNHTAWYKYVTPSTGGTLAFTLANYAGAASGLTVYTGTTLDDISPVANGISAASLSAAPSTTYWVQVSAQGPSGESTSSFNLGWSFTGSTASSSTKSKATAQVTHATAPSGHSS